MPTAPGFGQVYNSGVKYIKISRYDSGGLDRTEYLNQLQSIKLTYPDRSAIAYPITTIQEQADYFIYGIFPGYNTSSKGNIENYSFSASCGAYHPVVTGIDYYLTSSGVYTWGVNNDSLNAFTTGSNNNYYTYPITPNIPIEFSFTATFLEISPGQIAPYVLLINKNTMQAVAGFYTSGRTETTVNFTGSIILTGSSHPIENNAYIIAIGAQGSGLTIGNWNFVGFRWNFTQSNAPFNGSSSLTIFDPGYINYRYDPYNPLINNAEIPQFSSMWMDVDYSQNPVIPINFGLIISGTADRAFIQDSNYSSKAWSNLRYNGSRTNSYRITQ
jgi:hypothetical protein